MAKKSRFISDLHWVRSSQQTRGQKTQQALLDAAQELFSEKGVAATSVADVAAKAGSSIGAVYHHFRDKTALLYALVERSGEEYRATTQEAIDPARWEGATIADIVRAYLEFSLELASSGSGLKRAKYELMSTDPAVLEHQREIDAELMRGLTELFLARRDEMDHPDPKAATAFVLDQLNAMLRARIDPLLGTTQLVGRSDEAFVAEVVRSTCAYLGIEPPLDLDDLR